ncbi:MAG: TraI domain-containing protein [Oscillospiraceae bacterium]|nr:TraI domain-containing protein [Oscillospiraceae bacterium]
MEYDKIIADLETGDQIEGFYVLKTAQGRVTGNGKPFLNAVLSDCSGAIEAKCWDYSGPVAACDEGKVVKIRGTVSEFRGALQLTIERLRLAEDADRFDLSRLVPVAPIDEEETFTQIKKFVESIEDSHYRAVCLEMLSRKGEVLRKIPAGKSVHHSFLGGLLMHTANMMYIADFLADLYWQTVDRSLLLAGTLLHDIAKQEEFTFSSLGLVTDYSVKGQLLGHLVMGAHEIAEVAAELGIPEEKSVLLQHMLLSHHGQPEFGAAVVPQLAESELLSLIDMMDSRMEIYQEAMDETPVGTFSKRIFALEKRIYHHD